MMAQGMCKRNLAIFFGEDGQFVISLILAVAGAGGRLLAVIKVSQTQPDTFS